MLEELKHRVYEANMLLPQYGLVTFTWGNASELDQKRGIFAIKPSGVDYDKLRPEDMRGDTTRPRIPRPIWSCTLPFPRSAASYTRTRPTPPVGPKPGGPFPATARHMRTTSMERYPVCET